MPTKKKNFINLMCEIRDLNRKEVVDELSMVSDMNGGLRCPVPGCKCTTLFKRWGDMRGHFLDDTTHKKDYFHAFLTKMHEPFCDQTGPGFNHCINSLMLALIRQPTTLEEMSKEGSSKKTTNPSNESTTPKRLKKVKPLCEQGELAGLIESGQKRLEDAFTISSSTPKKGAFSQISEFIRDSEEINKVWRGKVWEQYVEMFHGIPPCFHCRSEEGKQIHHQNPLFHEIILVSLNKLGTTAEQIVEEQEKGNEEPLNKLLQEVSAYHMKPGKVCAVPYCQSCNQDAEIKRKKGRRLAE
jgi:hypothetical protein